MASLAARMSGVRLDRGLASFRNGCCERNGQTGHTTNLSCVSLPLWLYWFFRCECDPYLQQFPARAALLYVHLQTAGQEGLENRGELLRALQLGSPVGGD